MWIGPALFTLAALITITRVLVAWLAERARFNLDLAGFTSLGIKATWVPAFSGKHDHKNGQ
jgi:hypothetical protein